MKRVTTINENVKQWVDKANTYAYDGNDILHWKLFFNKYNPKDYSYFTSIKGKEKGKEVEYTYPAKFRWIPIQRKNLNVLISTQELRPFIYNISVSDQAGINRKFHAQAMGMVNYMFNAYKEYDSNFIAKLETLNMQKQQMQQMVQKQPENEQEALQQQQLQMQMPFINSKISVIESQLENQKIFSSDKLEKLNEFFTYEAKDFVEVTAQYIALKIQKETDFKSESNRSFVSRLVTGKPAYYVNHERGDVSVTIKSLDSFSIIYPRIENVKWIQEGPWVAIKEQYSYSDVVRLYGDLLTSTEIKSLKTKGGGSYFHPVFASTNPSEEDHQGSGALLIQDGNYFNGSFNDESVEVLKIWYKLEKKLYARISINKYNPARPHIHFVDEKNIKESPLRTDRGEKLEVRYLSERYYGIIINKNIYIGFEKDEIQPRDSNNLSKVYLPVVGKSYSSISDQPSSLIEDTKDLNELYQVLNYHRELYVAVSGVKGQIIDISQKPTDMSLLEQRYHRKQGSFYIQTKTKTGKNIGSNYNQWKSYDDSISPGVGQIDNMMANVSEEMGMIMGVPRQRVGQTVSTDQVGTNEQAVNMANLVTETLHYSHDDLDAKALEMAVNIHMNHLLKPGELLSVPTDDLNGTTIFKVPEFDNKNAQIKIFIQNNKKQFDIKRKLEALAAGEYQRGQMPFTSMMKVYTTESLKELEKKLEYFSNKVQKAQAEAANNQYQSELQKEELKNQVEMALKEQDIKARMAELEFQRSKQAEDVQLKLKEIETNKNLKLVELSSERETEATYLQEQNRASTVDEELEYLRIKLEALIAEQQLMLNEKQGTQKHVADMKKATNSSTKKQSKEKIKD